MLRAIDEFRPVFAAKGIELSAPNVTQILPEAELIELVPQFDGWIIGDDPATGKVFEAGKAGHLKAAVKWGVGVDNVNFAACKRLGIPISNTPGMFGREVADVAMGYVIGLARHTFEIDHGVKSGLWPKPAGISLAGRTVALVGFGDIGRNTAKRLIASEMKVIAYDPYFKPAEGLEAVQSAVWPQRLAEADFLVLTCALTKENLHLVNATTLNQTKPGVRIVNVARGPLIDEPALVAALASRHVHSAALDVFEEEPLPASSALRSFGYRCVFGAHNGSNTTDAVRRTSEHAIKLLFGYLNLNP
jgi:D-3-phosphoglycerate dehydrogenase